MTTTLVKKPGYMFRAVVAWMIFQGILLATLAAIVYILGASVGVWFVEIPLIIGVIASEWIIMGETIAPIIKDWIKQESYQDDAK